jgi:DNA-binding response OmpR family regulator
LSMSSAMSQPNGARAHILVVENDDRALASVEAFLTREGYEIRTTWSGREALALLQSYGFDLVLVADHLPDIYCGEFVKLASRRATSVVVMHAGKPRPTSMRRYKALGASAVMDKSDAKQLYQFLISRHGKPKHS